jgi:hypothetical protein
MLAINRPNSEGRDDGGSMAGKCGGATEVLGGHHQPGLRRNCLPGPMQPDGVANFVGVQLQRKALQLGCIFCDKQPFPANCFHLVITPSYLSAASAKTLRH